MTDRSVDGDGDRSDDRGANPSTDGSDCGTDRFTLLRQVISLPSLDPRIVFFTELDQGRAVAWCHEPEMVPCEDCRPGKPCGSCDDTGLAVSPVHAYWREQRRAAGWHPADGHC